MKKEIIEIEVKGTGKGIKKVDKLKTSISKVKKETDKTKKSAKEMGSTLDKVSGGAVGRFKGMLASVKSLTGGFNILKIAIIGTGIGALLIAILAVKTAFTNTEEGQNKFAKLMGIIGSVVGNLVDILASFGEKIISVFENPKQAIKDFAKAIKQNITNRISSLIEMFGFLGSAIKKVFSRDFKGAMEDAKKAGSSYMDTLTGVKDSINKVSDALKKKAKEIISDAKIAGQIADQRAKADKIERRLIVERAQADKDIADLRFKSEQRDKFTAAERVEFLKEAGIIAEEISNKEIAANKLRLDAKIAENKLAGSNKADLEAVANLKAKGIQLDTAKLNLQKRLQTSLTTFQNEEKSGIAAINKLKEDDILKGKETERKRLESIKKIQDDFKLKQENEDAETEIEKAELELQRTIIKLDALNAEGSERFEAISYWENKISNLKDGKLDKDIKASREANDRKIKDDEIVQRQKLNLAKATFGQLSVLLGKNSKAAKAASIAAALINTYQGISEVWGKKAESPFLTASILQKVIASVFVASQGFAAVKNIAKTKTPNGSSGGGGASATAPSMPSVQSPSFNIVGSSDTNQLAALIGSQMQEPIQAYVVSNDVTTSQSLERSIIEESSLG